MILDLIRAEKDSRGLTNEQLSNLSGVPVGTINRVLSGKTIHHCRRPLPRA